MLSFWIIRLKFGLAAILVVAPLGGSARADDPASDSNIAAARENHWAWQPLHELDPPKTKLQSRVRTPVDAFVFSTLDGRSIAPAKPADPATLLRRIYLDLIGLPPTPSQQEAFLKDPSDKAYQAVVDDLLGRSQYGERWGRHWLDVVRYAETKGYERDEYKRWTWRYRDYVIDAFNDDLPYDQFLTEQLAGDEIGDTNMRTQIATTFLSLGPFDTIAADGEVARYDTLDDIVATTSMAFLGQTVQCARCHDHKFEPITQVDYHRLLAAFESLDVGRKGQEIGTDEDKGRHREELEKYNREVLDPIYRDEEKKWLPHLERLKRDGTPKGKRVHLDDKRLQQALDAVKTPPGKRTDEHRRTLEKERGRIRAATRDIADDGDREILAETEKRVKEGEAKRPQPTMAWVYPERGSKPPTSHLRIRGDVHQKGEEVPFGLPTVLEQGDLPQPEPTKATSGRRLALAKWMTGAGAPLVARVMANRIWQFHFGRGLVPDANNLGIDGGDPSHPELLEWLAAQFVESGWKLKPLHRQIVLSETYRLSAQHDDPSGDPQNHLFSRWPVHRLEAEAIRDSVLFAGGNLNLEMGGPSIYPKFERQVVGASSKSDWGKSTEEEAARRSIYVFSKRALPLPELAVLGSPDSSCSCAKRVVSTTAVQSLLMMNGRFLAEQSERLAGTIRDESGDDRAAQVRLAFRRVLCRSPRADELDQSLSFLASATSSEPKGKVDPLTSLCLVLLNTNEFVYRN